MNHATSKLWLHGTEQRVTIDDWAFPPPSRIYKPEPGGAALAEVLVALNSSAITPPVVVV